MDGSFTQAPSIAPSAFGHAATAQESVDSLAACWLYSTKPSVGRWSSARHVSAMQDVVTLKARVRAPCSLSDELIDRGAGCSYSARGMERALADPSFAFTAHERADAQHQVDSDLGLSLACRDELSALPTWGDLAKCLSWQELAAEARRREKIA